MTYLPGEEVLLLNKSDNPTDWETGRIVMYHPRDDKYTIQLYKGWKPLSGVPARLLRPSNDTILARTLFSSVGITF